MPTFASPDKTVLSYQVLGDGEPLLCVPGGPGRAGEYLAGLAGTAGQRSLVLLDNRGTGASHAPADPGSYRMERLVDDIEALRAHLGLERVDLLGHSSAGNTALLYALRHPERVSRLVLVAPSTRAVGIGVEDYEEALARRAHEDWYETARAGIEAWTGSPTIAASLPHREQAAPFFYGRWDEAAMEHARSELRQMSVPAAAGFYDGITLDTDEVRRAAAGSDTPTLVVTGELDPFPTPATGAKLAALLGRGESRVQPGAGHYPWLDDRETFARTLVEFLARPL
ncbi:alpha/beta hydrolase [Streptomyces populi]|uniref:Alpha/beta hydrolase n=1 Tax=Streptomyces populi TaxID=2058924 RepID=A0A2I0SK18_9ACTN|nr:alpha/beta hydrolase [Streptomyces populi]PKT70249.1 alpha/beta hydrolase [Streptomyces populi]